LPDKLEVEVKHQIARIERVIVQMPEKVIEHDDTSRKKGVWQFPSSFPWRIRPSFHQLQVLPHMEDEKPNALILQDSVIHRSILNLAMPHSSQDTQQGRNVYRVSTSPVGPPARQPFA
jgi:hypothetical protein